jgi:hypothetical protein
VKLRYFCSTLGHNNRRVSTPERNERSSLEGEGFECRKNCLVIDFGLAECGRNPKEVEKRSGKLRLNHSLIYMWWWASFSSCTPRLFRQL